MKPSVENSVKLTKQKKAKASSTKERALLMSGDYVLIYKSTIIILMYK